MMCINIVLPYRSFTDIYIQTVLFIDSTRLTVRLSIGGVSYDLLERIIFRYDVSHAKVVARLVGHLCPGVLVDYDVDWGNSRSLLRFASVGLQGVDEIVRAPHPDVAKLKAYVKR